MFTLHKNRFPFASLDKIITFDYMKVPIAFGLTEQDAHQLGLEWHEGTFYKTKMKDQSEASAPRQHLHTFFSSKEPEQTKSYSCHCKCRPRTFLPSVSFRLSLVIEMRQPKRTCRKWFMEIITSHRLNSWPTVGWHTGSLLKSVRKVDSYSIWIICGEEHCVTKTDLTQEFLSHDNRC